MSKVKDQSSRFWVLALAAIFLALNLVSFSLYSELSSQKLKQSLSELETLDYKRHLYSQLYEKLGYGHYIQNYRDWIISRGREADSTDYEARLQKDFQELNILIDSYESHSLSHPEEREALQTLRKTLKDYHQKIPLIRLLMKQGVSTQEIFQQTKVDDTKALQAFESLDVLLVKGYFQKRKEMLSDLKAQNTRYAWNIFIFLVLFGALVYWLILKNTLFQRMDTFMRYREVLEDNFSVFKIDEKGRFTYVNPLYCQNRGVNQHDILGKVHPMINRASNSEIWQALNANQVWSGLIQEEGSDGQKNFQLTMQTLLFPVNEGDGHSREFVAIQFDVTDMKKAKRLAMEVATAQTYFLANVGHQLRTPLSAIMGGLKMLQMENFQEKNLKVFELVQENAGQLLDNVNELLTFADIEKGELVLDIRPYNIENHLGKFLSEFKTSAVHHGLKYEYLIDYKVPKCLCFDYQGLTKVLGNLIHNAIKFTSQGGEVLVRVRLLSQLQHHVTVEFEVSDTGIGISKENLEMIFNGFRQVEPLAKRSYGGTGIGLTIAQKLIYIMGGDEIKVSSHPNKGSSFRFQLGLNKCTKE